MSLFFTKFNKLDPDPHSFYLLDPDPHSEKLLYPDLPKMIADPMPMPRLCHPNSSCYPMPMLLQSLPLCSSNQTPICGFVLSYPCLAIPCQCCIFSNSACVSPAHIVSVSVVDPYSYWIRIQELPGSGSVFGIRIRIRIHTSKYRLKWRQKM